MQILQSEMNFIDKFQTIDNSKNEIYFDHVIGEYTINGWIWHQIVASLDLCICYKQSCVEIY